MKQQKNIIFSKHAHQAMELRKISQEWVIKAIEDPDQREHDKKDRKISHSLKRIMERDGRILRVVYRKRTRENICNYVIPG